MQLRSERRASRAIGGALRGPRLPTGAGSSPADILMQLNQSAGRRRETKLNVENKDHLSMNAGLAAGIRRARARDDPAGSNERSSHDVSRANGRASFQSSSSSPSRRPLATADLLPPVVSTAALADRLAAPPGNVVLLDARPAIKAYLAGHITGAQTINVDSFRSTAGGVPATLFPMETIHFVVHRLGITADTPVVVYGEESDVDATFVASILRIAGVKQVSILDGGFDRWTAEKRPVTAARKPVAASTESVRSPAGRPRRARRGEEGRGGEERRPSRRASGGGLQRGPHPRREVALLEEGHRPGRPAERRLLPSRGRREGRARERGRDRQRRPSSSTAARGIRPRSSSTRSGTASATRMSASTTAPGSSGRSLPDCRRKSRRLQPPDANRARNESSC